jgi:hypothetical protein
MASVIKSAPKGSRLRKGILTFAAIGAVGAVGAFASTALLTDDVALPGVEAHGGTLDLVESTNGTFTLGDLSNLKPGFAVERDVEVRNDGSVPGKFKLNVSGTDTGDGCYQVSITRSQKNASGVYGYAGGTPWTSPAAAQGMDLGTFAPGYAERFRIRLQMPTTCTAGSGVSSNGSALLVDRGDPHAEATLLCGFRTPLA